MAPRALDDAGADLKIVPVGLVYSDKAILGSEVVYTGKPLSVPPAIADLYEREPRQAVEKLTELIDESIRAVTVNLYAWEDLPLLELAGQICRS